MKLHPDSIASQSVAGYGPGWIQVGTQRLTSSVVLGSRGERFEWDCPRFEALTSQHFERLAALRPEVVIFGSGSRLRFARAELMQALISAQIGVETMDTSAACRTYNVLAGENRHVVAALILEA
ncbi:MAG: Mth938-like domain-containing protein [Rhodoferax sp.]